MPLEIGSFMNDLLKFGKKKVPEPGTTAENTTQRFSRTLDDTNGLPPGCKMTYTGALHAPEITATSNNCVQIKFGNAEMVLGKGILNIKNCQRGFSFSTDA